MQVVRTTLINGCRTSIFFWMAAFYLELQPSVLSDVFQRQANSKKNMSFFWTITVSTFSVALLCPCISELTGP